ncbi:MAG: hypothetical protein JNK76_23305 [Planctomycetales bacterium]|nr:hypothetical protein [Planctomycetales bacterium]
MIPVTSYSGILYSLADGFHDRYRRTDVNIAGVLFARPHSAFTVNEILPHLDYWHHRSDYYTDFYCPGYICDQWPLPMPGEPLAVVNRSKWYFDTGLFVECLEQFERMTSWRYRGGCELLISNVRCNPPCDRSKSVGFCKPTFDLSSAMIIDLEKAFKEKAFRDVSQLSDDIFQFAKDLNEATGDPCWELSDQLGFRVVKGSLKEFLLSLIPKSLRPEARKAFHFVAQDVRLEGG